ncbi:hypothetical protein N0O92_14460 [Alkalihalobacillus sp. MEB130]|nr:hypothetical protein [Alkalihalobacillus sp. MEB130]MDT8861420.1 hypothetical protein [Alkalihalobacillus sp. MEB130]
MVTFIELKAEFEKKLHRQLTAQELDIITFLVRTQSTELKNNTLILHDL